MCVVVAMYSLGSIFHAPLIIMSVSTNRGVVEDDDDDPPTSIPDDDTPATSSNP